MIMKNSKQIGFIYKNNESIDKIIKNGDVVFEKGFLREITSTTLPITFGGISKNLKDCKIYGNTKQKLLPDGYTQVDYIESSGTQYIDTLYIPNSNTKYDIKLSATQISSTSYFISAFDSTNRNNIYSPSNKRASAGYGSTYKNTDSYLSLNTIYNFVLDKNLFYMDNELIATFNQSTFENTANCVIFAQNTGGSISNYSKIKLYHCKIYANNVLIRDFIPCYRNIDNEVGLYDLVNNVFYTNQGTGTFSYGTLAPTPDSPMQIISCGKKESNLPFGYTQVEYVKSDDYSWIDMGLKGNQNTKITTSISFESGGTFLGDITNSSKAISLRFFRNNSGSISRFGNKSVEGVFTNYNYNTKYLIEINSDGILVDNELIHEWGDVGTFETTTNLYLFKNSTSSTAPRAYVYYCKVYDGNTLVRDFVPCYRDSDGVIGLYDIVNGIFYTNQGTGSFTYGNVVAKGGYKIPIRIKGSNLISQTVYQSNTNLNDDGTTTNNSNYYVIKQTNIKPLSKYILSENQNVEMSGNNNAPVRICAYDENDNFLSLVLKNIRTEAKRYSDEFIIPTNTDYILISFRNTDTNIDLSEIKDIGVYLDEPLRKIGEYSDYIDFKNGKVIRNIKEIILDGTEEWEFGTVSQNVNTQRFRIIAGEPHVVNIGVADIFIVKDDVISIYDDTEVVQLSSSGSNRYIGVQIYKNRLAENTVEDFKDWLSQNNILVDYVLLTTIEESITLPDIPTLDGNNTLNVDTELTPSQVYIKYKSNV